VACPYFVPTAPHPSDLWRNRYMLPLGDGFSGHCAACSPNAECDDETLRLQCNLGYATCRHLPADRDFDAVRFHVQAEEPALLRIQFCAERAHLPGESGELRYDLSSGRWIVPPELRIQLLAEAPVRAWLSRYASSVPQGELNCDADALCESNRT